MLLLQCACARRWPGEVVFSPRTEDEKKRMPYRAPVFLRAADIANQCVFFAVDVPALLNPFEL
jgi:hypothetical protein